MKNIRQTLEQLYKEIKYAQQPTNYKYHGKEDLMRLYGKAQLLRELDLIDSDEFMNLNHETIYFINTTGARFSHIK